MNFEIELRYEVLNPDELESFTQDLTKLSTTQVVDHYLDTPTYDLIKKGVYVRIRNEKRLDIKFNRECLHNPDLELQPYCEEYTFALPLEQQDVDLFNSIVKTVGLEPLNKMDFEHFKAQNKLSPNRTVDKIRTSYVKDDFTILIDCVKDLGTFLEIEKMANSHENLESITAHMQTLLLPLSLKTLSTGYDSLILRKQNFEQYLQGRFLLEEDKHLKKKPTS